MSGDLAVARQFMASGRADRAEPYLRLALASEPDNSSTHSLLARCLIARQAFPEATLEARESIRLAPGSCLGYAALAAVQGGQRHWRDAERSIREAIRLDPADPRHWSTLARALTQQGRGKRALAAAQEGLRLRPSDYDCLNERGLALLDLGRVDEARASIRSALVSEPESAALHSNLAFVLLGNGQNAAAAEEAREALRLNPTLQVAQNNLKASQRSSGNMITPYANRATNWWRHRPLWERLVFVGGLALVGLVSAVAWIMAIIIGTWWASVAVRRAAANPKNRFYGARQALGYLSVAALFAAVFLANQWPRQASVEASVAGFAAPWTLLLAAAVAQPRRAALFVLALGIVGVGSLGPSWLPDESQVGQPPLPSIANLDLNLTDYQLEVCVFDFSTAQDARAAAAGVNMVDERSSFMDPIPPPVPFPSDLTDPKTLAWEAAVTAAARRDAEFVYGCAVALDNGTP